MVTNDDYVVGARVLAASLDKVGARDDRLAIVGQHVSAEGRVLLEASKFRLWDVDTVHCDFEHKWQPSHVSASELNKQFVSTCTKLHLWNLTEFTKVVYLDADILVLQSVDELFERPGFAAAPDLMPPDTFNSGVMVIEPDASVHTALLEKLSSLPSHDGGDQGFLNSFFSDWYASSAAQRLPVRFNMQQHMAWLYPPAWTMVQSPAVIHFCGGADRKPWMVHNTEAVHPLIQPHIERWWELHSEGYASTGKGHKTPLAAGAKEL